MVVETRGSLKRQASLLESEGEEEIERRVVMEKKEAVVEENGVEGVGETEEEERNKRKRAKKREKERARKRRRREEAEAVAFLFKKSDTTLISKIGGVTSETPLKVETQIEQEKPVIAEDINTIQSTKKTKKKKSKTEQKLETQLSLNRVKQSPVLAVVEGNTSETRNQPPNSTQGRKRAAKLTTPTETIVLSDSSEEDQTPEETDPEVPEFKVQLEDYEDHVVCKSLDNLPRHLNKYWFNRFNLFSRYDEGCVMDIEGWYSVTPELAAKRIAERLACDTIIDGFCGVGGNAIQFALTCNHVIAIDNDPIRLAFAKHNATIYGVAHKIDFLLGDFFQLAPTLRADSVFLSPPWGGPAYNQVPKFDIKTMMPFSGVDLFNVTAQITPRIAYFLPRNTDYNQLADLASNFGPCEIEEQYSNAKFIAITAFYDKFT